MTYNNPDNDPMVDAVQAVAQALRALGNNDAATPLGGLEALGICLTNGLAEVAAAIRTLAEEVGLRG